MWLTNFRGKVMRIKKKRSYKGRWVDLHYPPKDVPVEWLDRVTQDHLSPQEREQYRLEMKKLDEEKWDRIKNRKNKYLI